MQIQQTTITVADFCDGMADGSIKVNKDYQRSDKVWPPAARSFLLETILLGYPMPKLCLYQKTDLRSRKTTKEIVDGQQRSRAILDFFNNDLRLSRSLETSSAAGRKFKDLEEDDQQRFLGYGLPVDQFVAATSEEIREIFRRINSYTVPLSAEEQRHAEYQGKFKWFIYRFSKQFDKNLRVMGVFSGKQLVRLADTKLFAEVCHALLYGITTTDKKSLRRLYDEKDKQFLEQKEHKSRIQTGMNTLLSWPEIHGSSLMKHYNVYSLLLAITHRLRPVPALSDAFRKTRLARIKKEQALSGLTTLSEALESGLDDAPKHYRKFVSACVSKTNTADQRTTRFQWFCRALTDDVS